MRLAINKVRLSVQQLKFFYMNLDWNPASQPLHILAMFVNRADFCVPGFTFSTMGPKQTSDSHNLKPEKNSDLEPNSVYETNLQSASSERLSGLNLGYGIFSSSSLVRSWPSSVVAEIFQTARYPLWKNKNWWVSNQFLVDRDSHHETNPTIWHSVPKK